MKLSTLAVITWVAPAAAAAKKKSTRTSPSTLPETCEDFNTGVYHGADVAEYLWKQQGSSCSNIWGFEDTVDDYLDKHYPTDTSNWKTNACNEGVEAGAEQVVDKYEKQCLNESPDECNDLGQVAAQMIAFDFCPIMAADSTSAVTPNYKAQCKDVAESICKGAIYGYVIDNGCDITTSELLSLQDDCEDQIESMVGEDDDMTGGEESFLRKKVEVSTN